MSGLFHHFYAFIKGYAVQAVGEGALDIGIQGACGGVGVAFNARNLYETADGVARHAEMVFQSHFGRVLNDAERAAEKVAGRAGRHGAGYSDFGLTPAFGSADTGAGFHRVPDEAGCGQGMEHALLGEFARLLQVVENGGDYAATATGGSGDNLAAACVFLTDGKGVGEDEATRL